MFSTRVQQYAKFIAAVVGALVTAATDAFGGVPDWATFIALAVTAIAVYAVPNATPESPVE